WQTGHPWSPFASSSSYDLNKDGNRTDRIGPVGSIESTEIHGSPVNGTLDPSKWVRYTCPASVNNGLWCDAPIDRNSVFGPHATDVDFNITKTFKVNERAGVTFQANFFDLFNHPNFLNPNAPVAGSSSSANRSQSDFSASRAT